MVTYFAIMVNLGFTRLDVWTHQDVVDAEVHAVLVVADAETASGAREGVVECAREAVVSVRDRGIVKVATHDFVLLLLCVDVVCHGVGLKASDGVGSTEFRREREVANLVVLIVHMAHYGLVVGLVLRQQMVTFEMVVDYEHGVHTVIVASMLNGYAVGIAAVGYALVLDARGREDGVLGEAGEYGVLVAIDLTIWVDVLQPLGYFLRALGCFLQADDVGILTTEVLCCGGLGWVGIGIVLHDHHVVRQHFDGSLWNVGLDVYRTIGPDASGTQEHAAQRHGAEPPLGHHEPEGHEAYREEEEYGKQHADVRHGFKPRRGQVLGVGT